MSQNTVINQILNAHLTSGNPIAGERVEIHIDQTLTQDATGTMAYLETEAMKMDSIKTQLSVSYVDHNMQQNGPENRNDHRYLRDMARKLGVVFSPAGAGICHQLHLENFGVPGATLLGSDSHTPTGGGLGMFAVGAGGLDVALAMAGVSFAITYPHVIGVHLNGKLPPACSAKDIALWMLQKFGTFGNVGKAVEYCGDGVATLSVPERATIANMGAEMGVTATVFPSDENTRAYLQSRGRDKDFRLLKAGEDAIYDEEVFLDLGTIVPMAACPSSPGNVMPIRELGKIAVDQVLIGSCTNGSYQDLMRCAQMLKGRHVAPGLSFCIAPGSCETLEALIKNGAVNIFLSAGARILECGCGPCIGQGQSPASGTVSVRTFNRNFAGRSGTPGDQVYLTSPESAVATALAGYLTDASLAQLPMPPRHYTMDTKMDEKRFEMNRIAQPISVQRAETIGVPPFSEAFPTDLSCQVLLNLGDKITTDHIMPAGAYLKYRSNIPRYSREVFRCFNTENAPSFAERAESVKNTGKWGMIVAGESYGQGSSREHAAICPMYLGIRIVIAKSIERIHRANLINFGILPLTFVNEADKPLLEEGKNVFFEDIPRQLASGDQIFCQIEHKTIILHHNLTPEERTILLAGGKLNLQK